ncbi:MAG: AAA family ATPase [Candidatus Aminicenantes bacterium]|nr:AAA family ATPase [Candidatus Aminicenantes bacterium]
MKRIRYLEIENFKTFGKKIHIDLGSPAVLIGPNNSGKTSAIQALALWNRGIRAWYEKKGQPQKEKRERIAAGINRLNILEVPVSETRSFWNNTRVRRGNNPIEMSINAGLEYNGKINDCRMVFTQRDSESIYCRPCPGTVNEEDLLAYAAKLRFSLLYPMSGIETEEALVQEGRINVLMGQGQTAQVLRNLCYKVVESDSTAETPGWQAITDLMERIFSIELRKPLHNANRGTIILKYRQQGVEKDLDISLAGRGLQQMLLILAFLYSHKGSILLIDEPDAHLEILRQKQVYEILKDVANKNESQVIIATHSEVILDDAVDTNLIMLLNGEAVNLAEKDDIKNALRAFGIDQYYRAKILPRILYVEGSTDLEILKGLAEKIDHPAYDILSGKLNCFYTRNIIPEDCLENRLDRASGAYTNFKKHFYAMKLFVPDFKGIALFDGDGLERDDDIREELAVVYWKNYELENYFITPEVILDFTADYYEQAGALFKSANYECMKEIIEQRLLVDVFSGDGEQLKEYYKASKSLRRTLLRNLKMSRFTEQVFMEFARKQNEPFLLNKGEFYRLIEFTPKDDIPKEVSEKLDLLVKYLHWEQEEGIIS